MPTYEFRCKKCGLEFGVYRNGLTPPRDSDLSCPDPKCGSGVKRVFTAAPAVWRGGKPSAKAD